MGKRADSRLIDAVLWHVGHVLIAGKSESSGPAVLEQLCVALRAIQAGDDVDDSLGIKRSRGGDEKPWKLSLAWLIHHHRRRGDTWEVIKLLADDWLQENGEKPLSIPRLRQVLNEKQADIDALLSQQRVLNALNALQKP